MSDTYTCAGCGGVFLKVWSDEEAKAEKDAIWPDVPVSECAVLCDGCWREKISKARKGKADE